MNTKDLKDISWQVSEDVYRKDSALSYSTLAKYEREGFNNLFKLFDKLETPSLTFGSVVDTLMTGSEEEFNQLFMVAEIETPPSDTLVLIVKRLFNLFKEDYPNIQDIPEDALLSSIEDITWNNHWLPKTRAKKIKEDCKAYYQLLYIAEGRTIIDFNTYRDAQNVIDSLKSSAATKFYFEQDNMFDTNIQRFYQLKFKETFEGISYRCMADLIIVIHDKKLIIPVDLKTSSKPEWDFYKSFVDWNYAIQARLYWRIIRANLDKDDYFKDFTLTPYKFIVANRRTLTPLVWDFESTERKGTLIYNNIKFRDPFEIGKELTHYLTDKPNLPIGITTTPNSIDYWLNNYESIKEKRTT